MRTTTLTAAVLGLVLLTAPLAASPDGKGLLSVGALGDVVPQSEKGYYYVGPARLDMQYIRNSNAGFYANAVAPLGEWGSLLASYSGSQGKSTLSGRDGGASRLEKGSYVSDEAFSVGGRLYTSVFVEGRFGNAEHGNPDGFLYWPVLNATVQRDSQRQWEQVTDHTGGWSAVQPAAEVDGLYWNERFEVVLPLQRHFSLSAYYGRQIDAVLERSGKSYAYHGAFESMGVKALAYVPLVAHDPEAGPAGYFPGLGWPGELLVAPSFSQGYDLIRGLSTGRQVGVSVTGPVNEWLALGLGYYIASYDSTYFASWPGFQVESSQPNVHTMNFTLTFSLGGLGWF